MVCVGSSVVGLVEALGLTGTAWGVGGNFLRRRLTGGGLWHLCEVLGGILGHDKPAWPLERSILGSGGGKLATVLTYEACWT